MYPDFYHLLKDLFGISIPALSLLKTFGFLVAISFFAAGWTLFLELKRKEKLGLISFTIEEVTIGQPVSIGQYLISALIGFFVGYKLVGMFMNIKTASPDPLSFIFSFNGNLLAGFVLGTLSVVSKYLSYKKESKDGIQIKKVKYFPSHRVGDMAILAAIGGFSGAKIFNAFETWDDFIQDPIGSLFSSSGLTFYGGLIVATIVLYFYARKIKLDFRHLCDAAAPGLILAYAIGRLGCQVSGDGDWGIYNSAYITTENGKVTENPWSWEQTTLKCHPYLSRHFKPGEKIPHKAYKTTSFPTWFVAYPYPKNVNHEGEPMPDIQDEYRSVLPIPVFPTPLYEFIMGTFIFIFLWMIRKKIHFPIGLFAVYLVLNGAERFLIEQIRVNSQYSILGLHPTQAEIISSGLIITGIILFLFGRRNGLKTTSEPSLN